MNEPVDILLLGSGPFAARIAFDLAATAQRLTRMLVAARDPRRLVWVRTAARGRAALFATPARFATASIDLLAEGAAASLLTQ
jgi:saccharopine dehydrogenase-like NADP-dependent oxidoreductase